MFHPTFEQTRSAIRYAPRKRGLDLFMSLIIKHKCIDICAFDHKVEGLSPNSRLLGIEFETLLFGAIYVKE